MASSGGSSQEDISANGAFEVRQLGWPFDVHEEEAAGHRILELTHSHTLETPLSGASFMDTPGGGEAGDPQNHKVARVTDLRPAWYVHGQGQRFWNGAGWTEHFIPAGPAANPQNVGVVGPAGRRGHFDCGAGLRRWWDGQNWIGPAIAPSSVPWKHTPIAYALLILWGALGIHRFYLRAIVSGTIMLGLYLIGAAFLAVGAASQASQATAAALSAIGTGAGGQPPAASAVPSVLTIVGLLTLAALAIWLLVDLCSLPSLVWALNNKNAARAIQHAKPAPTRNEIATER